MSAAEQRSPYYTAAQEVLAELGLHDRCRLSDVTARHKDYRWYLLFELGGQSFTVRGDEAGTEPTERALIKHRLRVKLRTCINDYRR